MVFVVGGAVFAAGGTVFAMDGAVSLQNLSLIHISEPTRP